MASNQSLSADHQDAGTASDQSLKDRVSEAAGAAADTIRDASAKASDTASEFLEPIKKQALDLAEEQKQAGAERLGGVAQAVHQAADQLDRELPPEAGAYIHEAADGIERMSAAIRDSSVRDLLDTANDFARRQPVAFFGGAVLAGFVLSRFLKSSSQAHGSARPRQRGSGGRSNVYAGDDTGGTMYGVPSGGTSTGGVNPGMTSPGNPK